MTMAPGVLLVLMGVPAGSEPPRTPIVAQTGEPGDPWRGGQG